MAAGHDTRARIKAEAMRLFVARGIDAVSVRDIADQVGMKPSNLYAHFRSREEMIQELFAEGYAAYGDALSAIATRDGPFLARLTAMIDLVCRLHDEDRIRFRFLLLTQYAGLAGLPVTSLSPVEVVQRAVAAAVAKGEIPNRDPALLTAMIFGIVLQTATFQLYGRIKGGLGPLAAELAANCAMLVQRPARL